MPAAHASLIDLESDKAHNPCFSSGTTVFYITECLFSCGGETLSKEGDDGVSRVAIRGHDVVSQGRTCHLQVSDSVTCRYIGSLSLLRAFILLSSITFSSGRKDHLIGLWCDKRKGMFLLVHVDAHVFRLSTAGPYDHRLYHREQRANRQDKTNLGRPEK